MMVVGYVLHSVCAVDADKKMYCEKNLQAMCIFVKDRTRRGEVGSEGILCLSGLASLNLSLPVPSAPASIFIKIILSQRRIFIDYDITNIWLYLLDEALIPMASTLRKRQAADELAQGTPPKRISPTRPKWQNPIID